MEARKSKIAILLAPGFADWEGALIAGTGVPFYGLDVQFFGIEAGEMTSQGGLSTTVSASTPELIAWAPDVIVIIGGLTWGAEDAAPDLREFLVSQLSRGVTLAGICGGTLALANAGLLNTIGHTSNDLEFLIESSASYSGAHSYIQSSSAISSSQIITAPGTAPVSFTAAVFKSSGVSEDDVLQFRSMMALEHAPPARQQPASGI